jgi:hypothetical protein
MSSSGECNSGHYFELLDRVHIASSYLQLALGDHPVLAMHPKLAGKYDAAVAALEEIYQAVGKMDQTWD